MSDLFDELDNATQLSLEEQRDLIPSYIAFRSELNKAEQENIARAQDWGLSRKRDPLTGKFPSAIGQLLADAHAWIEYQSYLPDEIAVRFHHRLVQIHPFPNGNGRHVRLTADLLVIRLGRERFSWGRERLRDAGIVRRRYIAALQTADHRDIGSLVLFARS